MEATVYVLKDGRVTIPQPIRAELGLDPGDPVKISVERVRDDTSEVQDDTFKITDTDVIGRVQGHEFEIGEFTLEIFAPLRPPREPTRREITGCMNRVKNFPFEELVEDNYPRDEPLTPDVTVECSTPIILQQTAFKSLPYNPQQKDIVDLEYRAEEVNSVE